MPRKGRTPVSHQPLAAVANRQHGVVSDPAFTRSRFEQRFRRLVQRAGLPTPSMNVNVAEYELDAYWPELRFAVELDLFETHGTRAAFERDRRRQEELKLLGVEMVRVTKPRLDREPEQVIRNLTALLARRRREVGAAQRA